MMIIIHWACKVALACTCHWWSKMCWCLCGDCFFALVYTAELLTNTKVKKILKCFVCVFRLVAGASTKKK